MPAKTGSGTYCVAELDDGSERGTEVLEAYPERGRKIRIRVPWKKEHIHSPQAHVESF